MSSETANAGLIDVQRTLQYRCDVLTWRLLWLPVLLLAGCWAILLYDPSTRFDIEPWLGVLIGIGWLLYAIIRLIVPEPPMLVLSSGGMIWRNLSRNLIPWQVIQDVTATDHTVPFRRTLVTYRNVSVVWVPRRFYNRKLFIRSLFWRGPFWANNFIHKDALTGIVIVHDLLAVEPEPLRQEIVARWQAFRETSQAGAASVPRAGLGQRLRATVLRGHATTTVAGREALADDKVATSDFVKWVVLWLAFVLAGPLLYFIATSGNSSRHQDASAGLEASRAWFAARDAEDRLNRDAEKWARSEPGSRPPQPNGSVKGHLKAVTALASVDDGRSFLSAGLDGAVKLWDAGTARAKRDVGLHRDGMFADSVRALRVLPGGARVLTADNEGRIVLRALGDGKVLHLFDATSYGELSSLAMSADGRRALSVHPRGNLIVWDVEAGRQVKNLSNVGMQTAALSADGRLAITGGYDGALWLWDVEAGNVLRSLGGHSCCAQSVLFMPGDSQAVSGGGDNTVRLWDVASGEEVRSFAGHSGLVTVLAISADGRRIVSGSRDGTARVWDVDTGRELAMHRIFSPVSAVAFAPDGAVLVGGDERGAIRSWTSDGRSMRDFAGGEK